MERSAVAVGDEKDFAAPLSAVESAYDRAYVPSHGNEAFLRQNAYAAARHEGAHAEKRLPLGNRRHLLSARVESALDACFNGPDELPNEVGTATVYDDLPFVHADIIAYCMSLCISTPNLARLHGRFCYDNVNQPKGASEHHWKVYAPDGNRRNGGVVDAVPVRGKRGYER